MTEVVPLSATKMHTFITRRLITLPKLHLTAATIPSSLKLTSKLCQPNTYRQSHHSAAQDMMQREKYNNLYNLDISKINVDSIKAEFSKIGEGSVTLVKDENTGIAKLTLTNPRIHSALSGKMMCELNDAIVELEGWSAGKGVILLSDDPKFFSSGADLKFAKTNDTHEDGYKMSTLMHDSTWRLTFMPYLTMAIIRGGAIGGGAELVTSTDLRVFSPSGSITFVQAKWGLTPGWGGGSRLVRLVGQTEALKALLTCRTIEAKEATDLGLCDLTTYSEGDKSIQEAELWLDEQYLAHSNADIIRGMKSICLQRSLGSDLETSLEHEKVVFTNAWGGNAFHAAISRKIKHR